MFENRHIISINGISIGGLVEGFNIISVLFQQLSLRRVFLLLAFLSFLLSSSILSQESVESLYSFDLRSNLLSRVSLLVVYSKLIVLPSYIIDIGVRIICFKKRLECLYLLVALNYGSLRPPRRALALLFRDVINTI
jgi:hypothetical protein